MKITGTPENGYEKAQIGNDLFLTNIRSHHFSPGDYAEWDLSDPSKPILNVRMTKDPDDHSFARGFPMMVRGTAFLKLWDAWGYNIHPRLFDKTIDKNRIVGLDRSPWFDYSPISDALIYPCLVRDMPETIVHADAYIPPDMKCNTLTDTYALIKESDSSEVEQWQKLFNVQFQMDKGAVNIDGRHAWGWSGGTVIGHTKINGVRMAYARKLETAGRGNRFYFASFCALDHHDNYIKMPEVCTSDVWAWLLENWGMVADQAEQKGVPFDGVTHEGLYNATSDGVHSGCEILGGAVGQIKFDRLKIVVSEKQQAVEIPEVAAATGGQRKTPEKKSLIGRFIDWLMSKFH